MRVIVLMFIPSPPPEEIEKGVERDLLEINGVEPYAYLKDVLQRLPSHPINRVAELLPFNWTPAPR